jgi:hypothetical protein
MNDEHFLNEVNKYYKYILENKKDDECAHAAEDNLHLFFIAHFHEVSLETAMKARLIILEIETMEFSRWCA